MTHSNLPRVGLCEEKWMPGLKGVTPSRWAVLERALDEVVARGRRRVAVITTARNPTEFVPLVMSMSSARGLEVQPTWIQQVDHRCKEWAAQLVRCCSIGPTTIDPKH
jgi:hypothetical protein